MKLRKLEINKQLLPMKGHFFLSHGGTALIVPYLTIYPKQLGFSSFIVGTVYTVTAIVGLFLKPPILGIADKYKIQKSLFLVLQLISISGFLGVIFLPGLPTSHKVQLSCDKAGTTLDVYNTQDTACATGLLSDAGVCRMSCFMLPDEWNSDSRTREIEAYIAVNNSYQPDSLHLYVHHVIVNGTKSRPDCSSNEPFVTECNVGCNSSSLNELIAKPEVADNEVVNHYQFWLLIVTLSICLPLHSLVINISDAICFQLLGDKPHKYGFQRMFGALGWGVFALISGPLIDFSSGSEIQKNYTPTFAAALVVLLLCTIVSYKIEYSQQPKATNLFKDITHLLLRPRVFILLICCTFMGACSAFAWNFLFWLLEDLAAQQTCDAVSWIKTIEGLTLSIQCLAGELPFYFLSTKILKKVGHIHSMTIVLFASGVRLILYSVIVDVWYSLPVAMLSGGLYALYYATTVSYASIVAPAGAETTTQGLVSIASHGIGFSLGNFIGGTLIAKFGSPTAFRLFGLASLVVCALHAAVQYIVEKCTISTDNKCTNNNTTVT